MKLTVAQPDLMAGINRVRSVVLMTSPMTVLTYVKLVARSDALLITATDYTVEATAHIPATVETENGVLVAAGKLIDFVRRIPADRKVIIDAISGAVSIRAGRSRAKLPTLPFDKFPSIDKKFDAAGFTLTPDEVGRVLFDPLPAVSDNEIRYYLCGVFLHIANKKLCGVATDGVALIKKSIDAPEDSVGTPDVIIPEKTITTLQRCMSDENVTVSTDGTMIRFTAPEFSIVSRVIDGTFPDYNRIIPSDKPSPVTVNRAEALAVIDRVSSVADDHHRALIFERDADGIAVHTDRQSTVDAADVIEAEVSESFPYVGFAAKQVAPLIKAMKGDSMTCYFGGTTEPHAFSDSENPDDVYILMPVLA